MRILVAADLHPEHNFIMERCPGLLRGMEDHEVELVEILDFWDEAGRARQMEEMIADARRRREFFDHADLFDLNRRFLVQMLDRDWDMLWLCTISHWGQFLLPITLRRLRAHGYVVGFLGDDEFLYESNRFWCPLFDAVVGYTEKEVDGYRKWNPSSFLLPIGVPLIEDPPQPNHSVKVAFVGRPYGTRPKLLRQVREAGLPLQIFGHDRWGRYPELASSYRGFLHDEDFWDVLASADIVLNLMEDRRGKPHINAKVFEAAAVGTMVITSRYQPFESTYGLVEGEDIVFYDRPEDLIEKASMYLNNPAERRRVAKNLVESLFEFRYDRLYEKLGTQLIAAARSAQEEYSADSAAYERHDAMDEIPRHEGAVPLASADTGHDREGSGSQTRELNGQISVLPQDSRAARSRQLGPPVPEVGEVQVDPSALLIARRALAAGLDDTDGFYFESILSTGERCKKPFFTDPGSIVWAEKGFEKLGDRKRKGLLPLGIYFLPADQVASFFELIGYQSSFSRRVTRWLRAVGPDLTRVRVPATRLEEGRTEKKLRILKAVSSLLHRMRDKVVGI